MGEMGDGITAVIAGVGILGIVTWLFFGIGGEPGEAGPLGEYILALLDSAVSA